MTSPIYTLRSSSQFWNDFSAVAVHGGIKTGFVGDVTYTTYGNVVGSVFPIYLFPILVVYKGKEYNYQGAYNIATRAMSITDLETGLTLNYNPAIISTQ